MSKVSDRMRRPGKGTAAVELAKMDDRMLADVVDERMLAALGIVRDKVAKGVRSLRAELLLPANATGPAGCLR